MALSDAVKAPIPLYRVKNPFTAFACSTLFPPPFFPLLFSPRAVIPFPIAPFLSPLFRGSLWANLNGEPWSRLHLHLRMGRRDREGAGDEQRRKRDECGLHGGSFRFCPHSLNDGLRSFDPRPMRSWAEQRQGSVASAAAAR